MTRPTRRLRARRRIPADDLRCHPDLCTGWSRRRSASTTCVRPATSSVCRCSLHPNGVLFAVAAGTAWMAFRLPRLRTVRWCTPNGGRRGLEGDWTDADPWLTDISVPEGTGRLRGWARAAYDHATHVGPRLAPAGAASAAAASALTRRALSRRGAARRRTPLGGPRRARSASCASSPPSGARAACACGSRRRRSTSR